ncbi:FAD-dependent oxidoreductase [Candidatus Vidania fulgoroideorum]
MTYDILIIGAGHAGIEAANFLSDKKIRFLLITENVNNIGRMSCNPSIGGIGKSQLVKEIDSLKGLMGFLADVSGISYRKLNTSKGIAVQSTRIHTDKLLYSFFSIRALIEKKVNILQGTVINIIIKNNSVKGVVLSSGVIIFSKIIILSTGTFLNSKIYYGEKQIDFKFNDVSDTLSYYTKIKRFKTGTPPRLLSSSINYKLLKFQYPQFPIPFFSSYRRKRYRELYKRKNNICYFTKSNLTTNNLVKDNLSKSSMYSGLIKSKGPRYCPSLEDKIYKFPYKLINVFLENESLYNDIVYPTGLSNSLPKKKQKYIIKSIRGLEKVKILKYGFAIEYDYFDQKYLKRNLENKNIKGLYLAGQINGTTGYEEAAAQGIIAGINSYRRFFNKKQITIGNKNSYIEILINDLTKKKISEPYRMFTHRSDNRLYNREDNSLIRTYKSFSRYNIYNKSETCLIKKYILKIDSIINFLKKFFLFLKTKKTLYNSIKDKNIGKIFIRKIGFKRLYLNTILGSIIYDHYIKKENFKNEKIFKIIKFKNKLPKINYSEIKSISKEALKNIKRIKPKSLKDMYNIIGINLSNIFDIIKYINENKSS